LFAVAGILSHWFVGTASGDQTSALFGSFSIGLAGYTAVIVQVALIATVTALTSRYTVNSTLETID
jgi:cell division transport system permease protein